MADHNAPCKDRIQAHFTSVMDAMCTYYESPEIQEEGNGDLPPFGSYGLCFDLVEAGTFKGQADPYYRYQLSWGGPSDEFRIFHDGRVEYWFMDWFDGASLDLAHEDAEIIKELVAMDCYEWPAECFVYEGYHDPDEELIDWTALNHDIIHSLNCRDEVNQLMLDHEVDTLAELCEATYDLPFDTDDYTYGRIVSDSLMNGQFSQAKEQCKRYGLDYEEMKARNG